MEIRSQFFSNSYGVRKLTWGWLIVCSLIVCDGAVHANTLILPPQIEKEVSNDQHKGNQQLLLPNLPLGPHKPYMSGIPTGFIDSGINAEHPQLKGLVVAERDFTGEGIGDSQNHGTIVALIYLKTQFDWAEQQKDLRKKWGTARIQSFSPLSPIYSAKVVGKRWVSNQEIVDRIIKAISWLSEMKVKTISISMALLNEQADYTQLCDAIEKEKKVLFSISAGNNGPDSIVYPAACKTENAIVVGAVSKDGIIPEYSGPSEIVAQDKVGK